MAICCLLSYRPRVCKPFILEKSISSEKKNIYIYISFLLTEQIKSGTTEQIKLIEPQHFCSALPDFWMCKAHLKTNNDRWRYSQISLASAVDRLFRKLSAGLHGSWRALQKLHPWPAEPQGWTKQAAPALPQSRDSSCSCASLLGPGSANASPRQRAPSCEALSTLGQSLWETAGSA